MSYSRAWDDFLFFLLQLLLRSFASSVHLLEACSNTRTLGVADDKFNHLPENEFLPLVVSKLAVLRYIFRSF